jgi:hypothetical protein
VAWQVVKTRHQSFFHKSETDADNTMSPCLSKDRTVVVVFDDRAIELEVSPLEEAFDEA